MKYPVKKLIIPEALRNFPNGRIPDKYLAESPKIGKLYSGAAWWATGMVAAAAKDGIKLVPISNGYRSYPRQYDLFMTRYSPKPTGRIPQVTREWNQQTWYLKPNFSPCAAPGYSPHGWGVAQDWGVDKPQVLEWLRKNAPRFHWYWETQPTLPNGKTNPNWEPWHLIWVWDGK